MKMGISGWTRENRYNVVEKGHRDSELVNSNLEFEVTWKPARFIQGRREEQHGILGSEKVFACGMPSVPG
jgi:hypothetical protein